MNISGSELLELIFFGIFPEVESGLKKHLEKIKSSRDFFVGKFRESIKQKLAQPKAVAYTIICTFDDENADSAGNNSQYQLCLLVNDGRVIPVVHLGFYEGLHRTDVQSATEMLIRKLPRVSVGEIATKMPMCLAEAQKISATNI